MITLETRNTQVFQPAYSHSSTATAHHDRVTYFILAEAKSALRERRHFRKEIESWWNEQGWKVPEPLHTFDNVLAFGKPIAKGKPLVDLPYCVVYGTMCAESFFVSLP